MIVRNIIFSNRIAYRLVRYGAFWFIKSFFLVIWTVKEFFHSLPGNAGKFSFASMNLALVTHLFTAVYFCYIVAYWFWPRYFLRRRYGTFALLVVALASALQAVDFFITAEPDHLRLPLGTLVWGQFIDLLRTGPMGACVFFITLRLLKEWHRKQDERQTLSRENAKAELQLLKAQVHPHFLFNTLNSIYSFTLAQSPQAGDLVLTLSDMLRYMITSGEAALVPVEKELKMIRDYLSLEQVRYGNRLDLRVNIRGDAGDKLIAPMLMIPFVENAFKHGAGKTWLEPWIHLTIDLHGNALTLTLANSKPPVPPERQERGGIGLINIQKRLQLLYPGQHNLELVNSYDSFSVRLHVPLQEVPEAAVSYVHQRIAYAR